MKQENEIIVYQPDSSFSLEVRIEDETVWLSLNQIVELFESSKGNISEHLKNIFTTGELTKEATVRKFRTVQQEGNSRGATIFEQPIGRCEHREHRAVG